MGGRGSGRYRRGSRKPGTAIREYSLVLDAKELGASGVIRGDKRHGGRIESILSGGPTSSAAGRYLCDCRDTLPLWSQTAERRRLQLGTLSLEFERNGDSATQVVAILAGLTRLDFVY